MRGRLNLEGGIAEVSVSVDSTSLRNWLPSWCASCFHASEAGHRSLRNPLEPRTTRTRAFQRFNARICDIFQSTFVSSKLVQTGPKGRKEREREREWGTSSHAFEKLCCRASGGSSKVGRISLPCSSKWNLQKQKRPVG